MTLLVQLSQTQLGLRRRFYFAPELPPRSSQYIRNHRYRFLQKAMSAYNVTNDVNCLLPRRGC